MNVENLERRLGISWSAPVGLEDAVRGIGIPAEPSITKPGAAQTALQTPATVDHGATGWTRSASRDASTTAARSSEAFD
jgi:hypothetical protein